MPVKWKESSKVNLLDGAQIRTFNLLYDIANMRAALKVNESKKDSEQAFNEEMVSLVDEIAKLDNNKMRMAKSGGMRKFLKSEQFRAIQQESHGDAAQALRGDVSMLNMELQDKRLKDNDALVAVYYDLCDKQEIVVEVLDRMHQDRQMENCLAKAFDK